MAWPDEVQYAKDSNGNVVGLVTGIDVQRFGSIGTADDANVIQMAIDYAASLPYGGVVTLPAGRQYNVSTLVLKNKVVLKGEGEGFKVVIQSVGADSGALITLPSGRNDSIGIINLRLKGKVGHVAKWCFDFACDKAATSDGSCNDGIFENLYLTGWVKNISIRGTVSGAGYLEPFQWATFKKVRTESVDSASTEILKIIGQTGQVTFEQCGFGPLGAGSGIIPAVVTTNISGSISPIDITFLRCWFNGGVLGASISQSTDIRFISCWYENLTNGVLYKTGSSGSVDGMTMSSGTGYGVKVDGNASKVALGNNRLAATLTQSYQSTNGGVLVSTGFNTSGELSSGLSQQISITGAGTTGVLTISNYKNIHVNTSAVEIQTITGNHSTGDYVTLTALAGSIILNSTGNVNLSGVASPMTLASGASALFQVTDLGARRYRFISKSV